jgi:hypothetical protein
MIHRNAIPVFDDDGRIIDMKVEIVDKVSKRSGQTRTRPRAARQTESKPIAVETELHGLSPLAWTMQSGIYFLACGNRVKIGQARIIRERVQHIATGCPYEPILVAWIVVEGQSLDAAEREQHSLWNDYRRYREWFDLSGKLLRFVRETNASLIGSGVFP